MRVSGVTNKASIAAAPVILACVVFAPRLVTDSHSRTRLQEAPVPAADVQAPASVRRTAVRSEAGEAEGRDNEVPEAVDLYGNEVTDAVAKYQFDATGSLYELHSPQTEVPKLAPPKT